MKLQYGDRAYEIRRFENGKWVRCGCGESRDDSGVTLPKEVYERVVQGRTGKFEVKAQLYWLKRLFEPRYEIV
jgi:hypothetical protein